MQTSSHHDLALPYLESIPSGRSPEEPMPLVVVLHGRGASASDLADLAPILDGPGGYRFVFPDAPRPFEAYPGMVFGFSWFDGWPAKMETIVESRRLLLEWIAQLRNRYELTPGKIALVGFSQGGMMALDVGFRMDEPPAAIVVMSGAIYEQDLPELAARKSQPVLIVHGTADEMIPLVAARRARQLLLQHGVDPEYHEFPMGHHVTEESMAVVAGFVHRALE
ncbi:MAG TPA: dienelactone hydrolase family protein [Thermoanaerobaculia bacterium]|nr:dienelactone hydrolase family protein [Thermoanaerobaculia bacterium]